MHISCTANWHHFLRLLMFSKSFKLSSDFRSSDIYYMYVLVSPKCYWTLYGSLPTTNAQCPLPLPEPSNFSTLFHAHFTNITTLYYLSPTSSTVTTTTYLLFFVVWPLHFLYLKDVCVCMILLCWQCTERIFSLYSLTTLLALQHYFCHCFSFFFVLLLYLFSFT